jgi:hypothetical protein
VTSEDSAPLTIAALVDITSNYLLFGSILHWKVHAFMADSSQILAKQAIGP